MDNFHKSKLIGINLSPHFFQAAANLLCCRIEEKLFSFLGISAGFNSRRISSWHMLISKLKVRLYCWTEMCLNVRGKITLLKSVLCSLSIFQLSFYRALVAICKDSKQLFLRRNIGQNEDSLVKME